MLINNSKFRPINNFSKLFYTSSIEHRTKESIERLEKRNREQLNNR